MTLPDEVKRKIEERLNKSSEVFYVEDYAGGKEAHYSWDEVWRLAELVYSLRQEEVDDLKKELDAEKKRHIDLNGALRFAYDERQESLAEIARLKEEL